MDYLSGIWGQEQPRALLSQAIEEGRVNHAYLFSGPAGVGKFATARAFAYQLIAAFDPQAALYFREQMHPDLLVLEIAPGKKVISKEQISKELGPWLGIKPYRARHKIAIIRDCQNMSDAAANALLKMLEDPPAYGVIILVSDREELLKTIISRCQPIRFHLLGDTYIRDFFQEQGREPERAHRLARIAQGSMETAAILAAEDDEALWSDIQGVVMALASGREIEVFTAADIIARQPLLAVNLLETILRDLQVYIQTGDRRHIMIADNLELFGALPAADTVKLARGLKELQSWKKHLRDNTNPRLLSIKISYIIKDAIQ